MPDEYREEKANNLLNNELFNEAFDVLRKDLMDRWSASGSSELEARESIGLRCDCLTNFMVIYRL